MDSPRRYRKKPVEIEAWQFSDPDGPAANQAVGASLAGWCGGELLCSFTDGWYIEIPTLEGTMRAEPGDWIIRGVEGEFYPVKPAIFEATYEECADHE